MKKLIKNLRWLLFLFCFIFYEAANAQVVNYPVAPYYIGVNYNNTDATITHQGPIIAPKLPSTTVDVSGNSNVAFKSGTQVELNPGFVAEPDANGSFVAEIDPQIDYILISPDPNEPSTIDNGVVQINEWEKLEIGFKLPQEYQDAVKKFFDNYNPQTNSTKPADPATLLNPYADDSLNVEVHLTSPSGRQITKWGFFMREADFTKEDGDPDDIGNDDKKMLEKNPSSIFYPYNWRFRFAPDEVGSWTFYINIINEPNGVQGFPSYTYSGFSFNCVAPLDANHGFLKVNQNNKRFLQFDDGTPFFGIGENLADICHDKTGDDFFNAMYWYYFVKRDYKNYLTTFDEMNDAGANYARIYMLKSNFAIEWQNLGVYDAYDASTRPCCNPLTIPKGLMDIGNRQYNLWAFDKIIDKAHEDGIYIQLCVDPYPPGTGYQDFIWGDHAYAYYNYDVTGKTNTNQLFVDDNATHGLRYYWKRRYKYLMSRYGYSVNLADIETFNEIDGILGFHNSENISEDNGGYCEPNWGNYDESHYPDLKNNINDWHNDILGYARATLMGNANKHLCSVSYTEYGNWALTPDKYASFFNLFNNENIDLIDIHHYLGKDKNIYSNSQIFANDFVRNSLGFSNKPFHFGEYIAPGSIYLDTDGDGKEDEIWTASYFNNYDISFHNELWASTFMGNFTTGLTWLWQTVHWWPDANPIKLVYGYDNSTGTELKIDINNKLGEQQPADLLTPTGLTNFTNKKIYNNFKSLSDFIQLTSGIDFSKSLEPHKIYNESRNIEIYYLMDNTFLNKKAYGWIHNIDHYWLNDYYYYYVNDGSVDDEHHYLSLETDCSTPIVFYGIYLHDFNYNRTYSITFYPTREDQVVPESQVLQNNNGNLYLPSALLSQLGCDDENADFAFVISDISNARISGDTINNNNATSVLQASSSFNAESNEMNKDDNNLNILITPNPSDGIYSVESISLNKSFTIHIYDAMGKLVYENNTAVQTATIDISNQPMGIYYMKITTDNIDKFYKLILK